jgi:hypothetical protein
VLDLAKSVPRLHGAVTAQRAIPTHFGFQDKRTHDHRQETACGE